MTSARRIPRVLSIAGSDSGGGAGIQADLKAFAACGVHGMTAITAVTAQNTVAVRSIHAVPPEVIVAQVAAVVEDIGVDAVKVGMVGNVEAIAAVSEALAILPSAVPVVIDPVMVAESGAELLDSSARIALIERLLPLATVATPNLPEAAALVRDGIRQAASQARGGPVDGHQSLDAAALARAVHTLGPAYVVLTGGHREEVTDLLFDGEELVEIPGPRYRSGATHGSGCTHSSALAAGLAWGDDPLTAARRARALAAEAVRNGLAQIGAGAGPVDVLAVSSRGKPAGSREAGVGPRRAARPETL
jgi:hydroxymethylpyrimidine/phosphomethylpyrimidine kinase